MRRHPLVAYFALAFAISWIALSPLVLGLAVPAAWHGLGAVGPAAAAIAVASRQPGALRELLRSATRWRSTPGWLAVTLLSPLALFAIAVAVTRPDLSAVSARIVDPTALADIAVASLAYGFGEELGWRGFALPRLQRRRGAFAATAILAVLWAAWHAPLFAYRFPLSAPGVAGFAVTLFAGALWLTFLYNSTGGSVLAVALWHVSWNALNVSFAPAQTTVAVANALMLGVAAAVLWLGKPARLRWPAGAGATA